MKPEYVGLLGGIAEASDISAELGVSFEEASRIQRERSAERLREYKARKAEEPTVIFFQHPKVIAAKVAEQMGITPGQAEAYLAKCDLMAIETFCKGNSVPRSEVH
jgi:hypothetical protein